MTSLNSSSLTSNHYHQHKHWSSSLAQLLLILQGSSLPGSPLWPCSEISKLCAALTCPLSLYGNDHLPDRSSPASSLGQKCGSSPLFSQCLHQDPPTAGFPPVTAGKLLNGIERNLIDMTWNWFWTEVAGETKEKCKKRYDPSFPGGKILCGVREGRPKFVKTDRYEIDIISHFTEFKTEVQRG